MIAIFAISAVAGIAGYARAETATSARSLIAPAIATAVARYEATVVAPAISTAFQSGDGSASPLVDAALNGAQAWSTQRYVLGPNAPSPLVAVVTIVPTSTSVPACFSESGPANAGADVEVNGQCSAFVQESRLSLVVTADAGPPSGANAVTPIAHGRDTMTLRLFGQAPYVTIAGVKADAAPSDAHEGDSGGYGNATGAFGPVAGAGDTTIHVIYACTSAQGDCSASNPQPADQPTSLPWTNGNTAP